MGAMLAPCWHFLRSWALLGRILRLMLRLLLLLAGFCASWNAPGSILEGFGWVLEPPGACFSRFLRAYVLALSERSDCDKTTVLLDWNTCRKQRAQREKSQKIALGAFRTKLSVTVVPKTRLGPHQARFWRRLGPSRACLGRVWGALGQVLGALGRLLGALGRLLAASWALLVASELS